MAKNTKIRLSIVVSVILILILTGLELPPPIGIESRSQSNVSFIWLILFLIILLFEIATIPLIYKNPKLGSITGITAGALNIVQIIADQTHMMQPEVANFNYLILEDSVGIISLILISICWQALRQSD